MKNKILAVPLAAALLLTACSNRENTPVESGDTQSSSITDLETNQTEGTSTETACSSEKPDTVSFLIGLDGNPVFLSDLIKVTDLEGKELTGEGITLDKLDADSFGTGECEGFCYLADPIKPAQNTLDTAGYEFPGYDGVAEGYDSSVFKRYNVGDKYGDLTVKKAGVKFDSEAYNTETFGWEPMLKGKDIDFPGVFYKEQYVEFEGEVTLTGYLRVNESSDYFPELAGETEFLVDDKSNLLPVAHAEKDLDEKGGFNTFGYCTSFGVYGENFISSLDPYGSISLGNIKTFAVDTSKIDLNPSSYTKVKVTIDNIVMPGDIEFFNGAAKVKAEVKKLEVID